MQPLSPEKTSHLQSDLARLYLNVVCSRLSSRSNTGFASKSQSKHGSQASSCSLLRLTKSKFQRSHRMLFSLCFFLLESLFVICCLRHSKSILCKPIRRLTIESQKISRFARPTLTPTFSTFERTPLDRNPQPSQPQAGNLRPS